MFLVVIILGLIIYAFFEGASIVNISSVVQKQTPTPEFPQAPEDSPSWSPDHRYYADSSVSSYGHEARVYDYKNKQYGTIPMEHYFVSFKGWTEDSRYAIFNSSDQYSNSLAYTFDTVDWTDAPLSYNLNCSMSGDCDDGAVAIAPKTSYVLLYNGRLLYLPESTATTINEDTIAKAVWSQDEKYLTFITVVRSKNEEEKIVYECTLFLTKPDYNNVEEVFSIKDCPRGVGKGPLSLKWVEDGQVVQIDIGETQYLIDIVAH